MDRKDSALPVPLLHSVRSRIIIVSVEEISCQGRYIEERQGDLMQDSTNWNYVQSFRDVRESYVYYA